MTQTNNPAGVLHGMLTQLKDYAATTPSNTKITRFDFLRKAFGVEDRDEVRKKFALMISLVGEIKVEIEKCKIDQDALEHYFVFLREAEVLINSIAFDDNILPYAKKIDKLRLAGIKQCDVLLKQYWPSKIADQATLESIKEETSALLDKIIASDIDKELKTILYRNARSIIQAIDEYNLGDLSAIRKNFLSIIGEASIESEKYSKEEGIPYVSALGKILTKLAEFAAIASLGLQLQSGPNIPLLMPSAPEVPLLSPGEPCDPVESNPPILVDNSTSSEPPNGEATS
ncbi:MAG: hypothetical protein AB4050_15060 [Synechococcus sp.]